MTHYTRDYRGMSPEEADKAALRDIQEYLSEEQWDALLDLAKRASQFQSVNMALGFTGVSGYPAHAFGRKYCLDIYREWMHTPGNGGPIMTDERGYQLLG